MLQRLPGLALALVLAAGTAARAQQPGEVPEADAAEPAAQDEPEPAATPAPDTSASSDDSPFDYKSSEKISEDLSVSFPVDI